MKLFVELNKEERRILRVLNKHNTPMYPDEIARIIYPMNRPIYKEISILWRLSLLLKEVNDDSVITGIYRYSINHDHPHIKELLELEEK